MPSPSVFTQSTDALSCLPESLRSEIMSDDYTAPYQAKVYSDLGNNPHLVDHYVAADDRTGRHIWYGLSRAGGTSYFQVSRAPKDSACTSNDSNNKPGAFHKIEVDLPSTQVQPMTNGTAATTDSAGQQ